MPPKPRAKKSELTLAPQPGPQTTFMQSAADVVIGGGAAGGGKSYALELEPLRNIHVPGFGAVIFRRTMPQIRNKGGLWDTAREIYGRLPGVELKEASLKAVWKNGVDVAFRHLEYEDDIYAWDGTQIPLLCFDELQHFTRKQFLYLLSRNRTACGVPAYCRATCNPMPGSWILELIDWYIDPAGYPIPERCGQLRYFFTHNEKFVTAATPDELRAIYHIPTDAVIKSIAFVHMNLSDNPALTKKDPSYKTNLLMQSEAERERLLNGNWKVRRAGKLFKREWFQECGPGTIYTRVVVGVDPSGSTTGDMQGIISVGLGRDGKFYVLTDATCALTPAGWGRVAVETYRADLADCIVAETNYGGDMVISNIEAVDKYAKVRKVVASRSKAVRAEPIASLYEKALVFHVGAKPELEDELAGFDPADKNASSPNRMDALVWAITELMGGGSGIMDYYAALAASGVAALPEAVRSPVALSISVQQKKLDAIFHKRP